MKLNTWGEQKCVEVDYIPLTSHPENYTTHQTFFFIHLLQLVVKSVVKRLQNELFPVFTYAIATISDRSLTSLFFTLFF